MFYADLCDPQGLARKSVYVNVAIMGAPAHSYAPLFVSDEFPTIVFVCLYVCYRMMIQWQWLRMYRVGQI